MTYYSRQGDLISFEEWAASLADLDAKRVGLDVVDGVEVSTVWLGIDHSFGVGEPLIFETMLFCDDVDDSRHYACTRYSTEAQARRGHEDAVNAVVHGDTVGWLS